MKRKEERIVLSGSHLFINEMDLTWSGLGFLWGIFFFFEVC